jgi:hypothetical protein
MIASTLLLTLLAAAAPASAQTQASPAWTEARREAFAKTDQAIARLGALSNADAKNYAAMLVDLKKQTDAAGWKQFAWAEQLEKAFAARPIPGQSAAVTRAQIEAVRDARLLVVYGWMGPTAFNEAWSGVLKDDPRPPFAMPEYPMRALDSRPFYCVEYDALSRNLSSMAHDIDPSVDAPAVDSLCEKLRPGAKP